MKLGRPRKIESPEQMWQHFEDYREWVKQNPIRVHDFVGKDAHEVWRDKQRPLTMEGFECFCFENGIINDLGDYFSNKNGAYEDFSAICRAIKKIIRHDQISGGMAGIYNPSITQRLNNLAERNILTDDDGLSPLEKLALAAPGVKTKKQLENE